MNRKLLAGAAALATLASSPLWSQGGLTINITTPTPGQEVHWASVLVEGEVIGVPGPAPIDEVFIRTRYPDGALCPPIAKNGADTPGALGWAYAVVWDDVAGKGSFTGRGKWLDKGQNFVDVYLPSSPLGSPDAVVEVDGKAFIPNLTDVVLITHLSLIHI